MNYSFNRDVKYSFLKSCVNPIQTAIIDNNWIKEKNIVMDVLCPGKMEDFDEENNKATNQDGKKWSDPGLEEFLKFQLGENDFNTK